MDHQVRLLFHEVADLTPAEREKVFTTRRVAPETRAEIESLLGFDSNAKLTLTDCVVQVAQQALRSNEPATPEMCGPYRLLQLLGSGGMGSVYLAERADGEIRQRVAIKLLRSGAERPSWQERFLRERQLLAYLNHPSVARVLDAGRTGDGRPYLVMEYVEGVPIDTYAAGKELREQIALFVRVCDAVAHAHSHLIIHRDLKPSNILVDSAGQPKLLDFGIAKLLDEATDHTQTVERLLTPAYASPEQVRGTLQTTATDVYSLGAVLYKLLTGRSPHVSAVGGAPAPIADGWEIPAPRRLNPQIPADIDHILRKALRSEPDERYASVEAFSNDLRAFLDSRPVQARSGNAWYRTRKFLRRYRATVAAAALVIASLSAGLYAANRQRLVAERRFRQLRQLSNKVFDLDAAIKHLPGSTEARQRLVTASLEYLEGLRADVSGDLDLAEELADAYRHVAQIQGIPTELNLGQSDQAERTLRKAEALTRTVLASRPGDRNALFESALIARDRMILATNDLRREDAALQASQAEQDCDQFLRHSAASQTERDELAGVYANVSLAYRDIHMYDDALRNARRAIEIARTLPPGNIRLPSGLSLLANAQRAQGDLEGALQTIQEARQLVEHESTQSETGRMIDLYGVLWRQGVILGEDGGISLGRPAEAVEPLQKALDITEDAARKNPNDFASRSRLGSAARELGNILRHRNPGRALEVFDLGIGRLAEFPKNLAAQRDRIALIAYSSYALRALHRNAESRQRLDEAFAALKETRDYPVERIRLDGPAFIVLSALADDYREHGNPQQAIGIYENLLDRSLASRPDLLNDLRDAMKLSNLYLSLAETYRSAGEPRQAEGMEARRLELWRSWNRKLPRNPFVLRQLEARGSAGS